MKGTPGQILLYTENAVLIKTLDSAIFVTHLKKAKTSGQTFIKLPAVHVLKDKLKDVLFVPKALDDIHYYEKDGVGYLKFDFYNGAMSTEDCTKLLYAY
jgi:putative two-component system hydrogenase maturation factor HypX/HoxX